MDKRFKDVRIGRSSLGVHPRESTWSSSYHFYDEGDEADA